AIAHQILTRAGREEQAMLVSVAGVVIVLFLLVGRIGELFGDIKEIFGL
ncbi:MAG: stage III sporulation protein AC, partial [Clostridia bacterium]|nr:stage III sporulation protein AC [Clostridia bacterium]